MGLKAVLFFFTLLFFSAATHAEFNITRLKYDGGGDWYGNPTSINNLLKFINQNSSLKCAKLETVTEIDAGKIFSYPYLYLNGHGKILLTDNQLTTLRKHLLNGGFLHADDNYGLDASFRVMIKKLFPDKELKLVPFNHPIYNIKYKFPQGLPKIHQHDGKAPEGWGIFHEGRLILFYSYESDLGDGWEDQEVHNDPPEIRRKALEMGTNLVLYYLNSF